jgi:hypothetical protein
MGRCGGQVTSLPAPQPGAVADTRVKTEAKTIRPAGYSRYKDMAEKAAAQAKDTDTTETASSGTADSE